MELISFTKINYNTVEKNHPVLFDTIETNFTNLNRLEKEKIAGLVFESVIQSGGSLELFSETDEDMYDDEI